MTFLVNEPLEFAADSLRGFVAAHEELVQLVHGGVVRTTASPEGEVAIVVGGGSGHYPAFAGWVGPGFAHGAVCGNIFASPSASQVISVTRSADNGGGTLLLFGNYAGDCLQFGQAAKTLADEGIEARIVTISDDIASGTPDKHRERRGIAGDLFVAKIAAASAARGDHLDQVEELAWRANDATRSLGVAFTGCTIPGADEPLFEVERGSYELGLGIHGEPGLTTHELTDAHEIAARLVSGVLAEQPELGANGYKGRVAVILNGLGATKYEELFLLYADVKALLEEAGLTIVAPVVDEAVTSLDMAGVSLTVAFLDQEMEELWLAPAVSPAFIRGSLGATTGQRRQIKEGAALVIEPGAPESVEQATRIADVLDLIDRTCRANSEALGKLDSIAGDGDHGQGMVLGASAAADAAGRAKLARAGAATILSIAGKAWAEGAGGTSGALWGHALETIGAQLDDACAVDEEVLIAAVAAGAESVAAHGGAAVGDKTMVDATTPFANALRAVPRGTALAEAMTQAAIAATQGAQATADMVARKGRAKTHGDASLGHPDPGAISFSQIVTAVAEYLA